MKKEIIAIAAIALISTMAAVSCGKDVEQDSVSVALPKVTVASGEQTTTKGTGTGTATTTKTTATAVVVSGTGTGSTTSTKADGEEKDTETTTATKDEDDTPVIEPTEKPTEAPTEAPAPAANSAYSFGYGDLLSTSAISALGTPNYKSDPVKGCIPNGAAQITYQYSGVDVISYVLDDGSEYIYDIVVKSSSYSTDNGITVGSSRSDVIAAYGGDGSFYSNGSKELTFSYSGDTVSSFEFYSGF